jgi:hypothetical protein
MVSVLAIGTFDERGSKQQALDITEFDWRWLEPSVLSLPGLRRVRYKPQGNAGACEQQNIRYTLSGSNTGRAQSTRVGWDDEEVGYIMYQATI